MSRFTTNAPTAPTATPATARSRATAGALIALLLLCGCAVAPQPKPAGETTPAFATATEPSGFLKDYSRLKTSPYHKSASYEQSEKLGTYSQFIIEPVVVLARWIECDTGPGEPIDALTSTTLIQAAHEQTVSTLRVSSRIAERAGPGVARVKIAITRISSLAASGDAPSRINAAAVEVEIVDSVTGERLGAAIEHDRVNPEDLFDSGAAEATSRRYDLVKLLFTHWASRLNLWIERAKRGE